MRESASLLADQESPFEACSDESLFLQYRDEHNNDAFNALVQRYERELYSYLRRYLNDAGHAEDTFQETFVHIIKKASQFDNDRKFRPWLYTVATHAAIDRQRRDKHFKDKEKMSIHAPISNGETDNIVFPDPTQLEASQIVSHREACNTVGDLVASLSEDLRAAVDLVYYQRLKYREAAVLLGIPVGTVKSRLHSAMIKMHDASE